MVRAEVILPAVPAAGPASPTFASATAFLGISRIPITAPRNGMNSGAVARTPSRRSCNTCPYSWISSNNTNPTANSQPHSSVYAAIETSIEISTEANFTFDRISAPHLAAAITAAAAEPSARRTGPRRFSAGCLEAEGALTGASATAIGTITCCWGSSKLMPAHQCRSLIPAVSATSRLTQTAHARCRRIAVWLSDRGLGISPHRFAGFRSGSASEPLIGSLPS